MRLSKAVTSEERNQKGAREAAAQSLALAKALPEPEKSLSITEQDTQNPPRNKTRSSFSLLKGVFENLIILCS